MFMRKNIYGFYRSPSTTCCMTFVSDLFKGPVFSVTALIFVYHQNKICDAKLFDLLIDERLNGITEVQSI